MTTFKQFNTNQVVITPFHANKGFRFNGIQATASDVGIEYYQSIQGSYLSGSNSVGFTTRLDGVLVFNNIKQLYYSNYLHTPIGDSVSTASLIPGAISASDEFVGLTTGPRFDNFLQSSLPQERYFSQFSASTNIDGPSVISIPSKLFGEKIPPSTFSFTYTSSLNQTRSFVYDDSEGNLITTQSDAAGNIIFTGSVGQIFYSQGIAVFTGTGDNGTDSGSLTSFCNNIGSRAGVGNSNFDSASLSFSSSITIRENQYKCNVRDNEYSYTLNPSSLRPSSELSVVDNQLSSSISLHGYDNLGTPGTYILDYLSTIGEDGIGATATVTIVSGGTISNITTSYPGRSYSPGDTLQLNFAGNVPGGSGILTFKLILDDIINFSNPVNQNEVYYDFATGSYFSPYVTTVGLYNESYQLVAVGKLAQPTPISLYVDTTFVVNFDT